MNNGGIYEDEPEEAEEDDEDEEANDTPAQPDEEDENLRFYNPNQDPKQQRRLRATMRDHHRMVDGT